MCITPAHKESNRAMDILIVCPTYNRLFTPTLRSIFGLQSVGGRLDTFFPYHGYGDGERDSRDIICDKYNAGRAKALAGGYDAMLTIESDMIVPPDAAVKLAATDADVAYGVYVFRRRPFDWNAYSVLQEDALMGWPLSNVPERARLDWGSVVDVDGVGLGCTLIRRHVLEAFPFRADGIKHMDGTRSHADWYAALDWMNAGYTQKCDLSVVCGHISAQNRKGKLSPCVMWPDPHARGMVRFDPYGKKGTPYAELCV